MERGSESKMSVTSSQRSAEEEEDFEKSITDTVPIDPVISFFSRQPPKKSFPSYPPNADPYDEDLAEQAFLKSKPTCFFVLGKPGVGKTTLAKSLASEWKCQFISATEVINERLKKKDDGAQLIKSLLAQGEAIPDDLVLQMIGEKIRAAEVAHQGYVLDDLPTLNEDFMTVQEQLNEIRNWGMKPDFLINIKIPDTDLLNRRVEQKVDPVTGEVYTKDVYDPEKPKPKKKEANIDDNEEAEEEAEEMAEEEESEEEAPVGSKLSAEVLARLLWRPEDQLVNVTDSIRKYNALVLQRVETLMAEHNQQYLIELDGNRSSELMLEDLLGVLSCFPIQPAVHPIHLADPPEVDGGEEEEEEAVHEPVEDMETEELMRSLSSKFAPSAHHRWRRSRWLRICPVALADGNIVPGKVEFTVAFLDKLYVLSSAAAMEKFMKNPRPFLMPPQPRPPCKIIVHGPAKAGKTQLCYKLADKYGAQVINLEQVIHPKIVAERNRRRAEFEKETTEKAIEEVTERLKAVNASEQRLIGEALLKSGRGSAVEEEEEEEENQDKVKIKITEGDENDEDGAEKEKDGTGEDGAGSAHSEKDRASSAHSAKQVSGSGLSLQKDEDGEQLVEKTSSRGSETLSVYPLSDRMKSDESVAGIPSATSIQSAADQPSENELATVPVYVDASTPEVVSMVQTAMQAQDFYDFQLPDEVWLETLEEAIADVEKSNIDRDPSKPLNGGWIVDNFPKTKEQWSLLVERNKCVPDNVIYLQDESPNGDFLMQRWYSMDRFNIDEHIELRKEREGETTFAEIVISGSREDTTAQVKQKSTADAAREDGNDDAERMTPLPPEQLLPEEGPELSAQRETRKLHDSEWAEIVNILPGSLEPIIINVATKPPDDVENGTFVTRSRNEIFEDAINNITKSFTYQAWERTGLDIDEEEAVEEEEEVEEEVEEPPEEEEQEEVDPNRSPDKQLGDTTFYCPVALVEKGVLWPGDPECSAKYREKIYYLTNEEARDKFLANPSAFLPTQKPFEPPAIRLLLLGPRGAGKSLHGRELAKKLGLYHIQFRERLQELVIAKTKKVVRPEREEEQELEEQDLPPDEEEEESDSDDSDTEIEGEDSKASTLDGDHPEAETLNAEKEKPEEDGEEEEATADEAQEVSLTEDEEAIVAYLKDDEPLPTELLQKLINDWWHTEPFKSTGFIIEGLPHSADEAGLMAELGLFPDGVVLLEVEDTDVIARLLPPRLARWRSRRKQKIDRRQQHKEKKQKKREAKIAKRRIRLEKEAAKKKVERMVAREAAKEDGEEEQEEEPEEEEEDIEAIIADEFPVEEEEPEEEEETEEDAIERMKSEISETCENDNSLISGVTEKLEELMIPCIRVVSGRKPHIVRYLLTKKLHSIVQCRYSLFERVYAVKPRVADKLLSCGYKQLSRFGRWCPVKLMEGSWMPADSSSGVPYFPAIYRQHIYFLSSVDARNQFTLNPVAFLCQPSPKPVVPIRIAIIGPPKSGKSTLANRFAKELGVMRLSIGEAIRWVLSNQPNSALTKCIQSYLFNGLTVPDECAVQALEVVLMSKTCRTRGYVLDGFPVKKIQIDYMEQRNIIPVQVIELEISGTDCADRATADRYSKDRVLPLHDSAPIFYVKWSEWQKKVSEVRQWYHKEHDNWVAIPSDKSKWWVWNAAVETTEKAVVRIQTYLHRTNHGLAASIAGMCITPKEFERRQGEFSEYCPVNLADKNELVDCSLYKHLTYAAEYKGLYYKMEGPVQLEKFLSEPDKYVSPLAPRHLPPPELLPKRRTKAEAKQMFPKPIELRGYCPVTFMDGKCRYEAIIPGDPELVVEYSGKLYCFADEDKLQKFMRSPQLYHNLTLPHKLPPRKDPLVVNSLPMLGYMEQTVAMAITKALTAVGTAKPKYPFVSATKSALIYAAYHLKAYNPKNSEYIRKKYKKKLDQFEEKCELIRYLGNHMTTHYREPKDRPIDFDFKMDKFVQLQGQDQVTSWVA